MPSVQENGENDAAVQMRIFEAVQRLHESDMHFGQAPQNVLAIDGTEPVNPMGRRGNPVLATQQAAQAARGVATRRSRREEREYRPLQVGQCNALAWMQVSRRHRPGYPPS